MPRHDLICAKDDCNHVQPDVIFVGIDESQWKMPKHCGVPMEICYQNLDVPMHNFESFTTRNIHPDAKPITIRNRDDLAFVAREYGVRHVNDPNLVAVGNEIRRKGPDAPSTFMDMGRRR